MDDDYDNNHNINTTNHSTRTPTQQTTTDLDLTYEGVVELLNEAKLSPDREDKQELLSQVFEFAFNKEKNKLADFFPHLLDFELDKSITIRKFVIACIETVCKKYPECIY